MPVIDRLISVVAPHHCLVCGDEGALLCTWCEGEAFLPVPSQCYRCQRLSSDSATCQKCRTLATPQHVWVVTEYEKTAKDLLHQFKFERTQSVASILTSMMARQLPFLSPNTIIVPVPTATTRIRQRGYDHAWLLARQLAGRQQLTWARAVTRLTQSRQVGANREQRQKQLQTAFMVTRPHVLKNADILLVDDILTTGATLEAITTVLKKAGAKRVNAIVFARKQRG